MAIHLWNRSNGEANGTWFPESSRPNCPFWAPGGCGIGGWWPKRGQRHWRWTTARWGRREAGRQGEGDSQARVVISSWNLKQSRLTVLPNQSTQQQQQQQQWPPWLFLVFNRISTEIRKEESDDFTISWRFHYDLLNISIYIFVCVNDSMEWRSLSLSLSLNFWISFFVWRRVFLVLRWVHRWQFVWRWLQLISTKWNEMTLNRPPWIETGYGRPTRKTTRKSRKSR